MRQLLIITVLVETKTNWSLLGFYQVKRKVMLRECYVNISEKAVLVISKSSEDTATNSGLQKSRAPLHDSKVIYKAINFADLDLLKLSSRGKTIKEA